MHFFYDFQKKQKRKKKKKAKKLRVFEEAKETCRALAGLYASARGMYC